MWWGRGGATLASPRPGHGQEPHGIQSARRCAPLCERRYAHLIRHCCFLIYKKCELGLARSILCIAGECCAREFCQTSFSATNACLFILRVHGFVPIRLWYSSIRFHVLDADRCVSRLAGGERKGGERKGCLALGRGGHSRPAQEVRGGRRAAPLSQAVFQFLTVLHFVFSLALGAGRPPQRRRAGAH